MRRRDVCTIAVTFGARLRRRPALAALLVLAAVAAGACTARERPPALDIATTTSVQNSGLLDALLPHYPAATVRVHAAGSGRALQMLSEGLVSLVISHAPETERRFLADHPDWHYQKLAHNQFIIVGPPDDPAAVRNARDAVDAFERIARAGGPFVSRGDGSGTHEREQQLWQAAGVTPDPRWLLVSGRGMSMALRHAQERRGYTLSDRATFWQLERQIDLQLLFGGGDRLRNTYAVIYPASGAAAAPFARWLLQGEGRERIAAFRLGGRRAFDLWPLGCPAATPDATPCRDGR